MRRYPVIFALFISCWLIATSCDSSGSEKIKTQTHTENFLDELMTAEMDYFLERNEFTTNFKELSLKLPAEQEVYIIDLEVIEGTQLSLKATPVDKSFKTYTGAAFGRKSPFYLTTILCKSEIAAVSEPSTPRLKALKLECPTGYQAFHKKSFN